MDVWLHFLDIGLEHNHGDTEALQSSCYLSRNFELCAPLVACIAGALVMQVCLPGPPS